MIPEGRKLPNLKYAPIMNIYNDDEIMVMFTSEETNMYKYGTNVHMSLSENLTSKVKAAFKKVHGSNYDKNMKSKVVDMLNRTFNINLSGYSARVYGMTGTEQVWEYEDVGYEYTYKEINDNLKEKIHEGLSDARQQELLLFWAGLYNVSQKDPTYAGMSDLAHGNVIELEKLKNAPKDLGKSNIESVENYPAETNAINNSDDGKRIEIAINYENAASNDYKNSGKTIINVLTDLSVFYINVINTHESKPQTERANNLANGENGATKYFEESHGQGDEGLSEYKYPALKNLIDIREKPYMVHNTEIFGPDKPELPYNNYDFNLRPFNTGDSCSDFAITAIRMLSNGYRGEPTDSYDKRANEKAPHDYGLFLHLTYAQIMQGIVEGETKDRNKAVGSLSFERAMNRLGWEKIYVRDNTTIEELKVGDLLVSEKHVEFYTGTGYKSEYYDIRNGNKNDWKKSGIKSIHQIYGAIKKLVVGGKAIGTFGWGGVHDEFPIESADEKKAYVYKNDGEAFFRICWCGIENPSGSHGSDCLYNDALRRYGIIWRKR